MSRQVIFGRVPDHDERGHMPWPGQFGEMGEGTLLASANAIRSSLNQYSGEPEVAYNLELAAFRVFGTGPGYSDWGVVPATRD